MKYTIEGLQQEYLISLNLDANDAVIIRFVIDFWHSDKMKKYTHEGKEYLWINYQSIIDNLPILKIKSKRVLARRFMKYTNCGLMEHYCHKSNGTFSCYRFTEKYDGLIQKCDTVVPKSTTGVTLKYDPVVPESTTGCNSKVPTKILLLEDTSINNNIFEEIKIIQYAYPSICPIRKKTTKTSVFEEEKIIKLINEKGTDYIVKVIKAYIADCKKGNTWIKAFKTFINNFPDLNEFNLEIKNKELDIQTDKYFQSLKKDKQAFVEERADPEKLKQLNNIFYAFSKKFAY